jgi:Zn finger protein HypA/HybF involved in hydrogenase expression
VHEVGLISAAIAQAVEVARRAGATRVERLTFAIAPDGHVTREAVQTLVEALAHGTLIEGAAVDVELADNRAVEITLTSVDVEVLATS